MISKQMMLVGVLGGVVAQLLYNNRFEIWCWWQGAARRKYPDAKDSHYRAMYARRWTMNLLAERYSIIHAARRPK